MKFQLISDLHLDHGSKQTPPTIPVLSDNLLVAGDISYINTNIRTDLVDFLTDQSKRFKRVFFVIGNHEFYLSEYYQARRKMKEIVGDFENVYLLDCGAYDFEEEDVRIVGCTLWTHVPIVKPPEPDPNDPRKERPMTINEDVMRNVYFNDWMNIRLLTSKTDLKQWRSLFIKDTNLFHEEQVEFLKKEVDRAKKDKKKLIILTHFAPSFELVRPYKEIDKNMKYSLATDKVDDLLNDEEDNPIKFWCYGHTHFNLNKKIGNVVCVSNQYGLYYEKIENLNEKLVLEI